MDDLYKLSLHLMFKVQFFVEFPLNTIETICKHLEHKSFAAGEIIF